MGEEDQPQPSWFKIVFHQWFLLMKKNFILSRRKRFLAVLQLVSPLLFMSVLFVVQTFVDQSFQTMPASSRIVSPSPSVVPKIPHCKHPFNSPSSHCFTLAYAPSNNFTDLIMQRIAENNDLSFIEDVISFNSSDSMDDYVLAHPNTTQAGYIFWEYEGSYEYSIMFNDTSICEVGVVIVCKDIVSDIALPMNIAMDRELIRYQQSVSGSNQDFNYTWSTSQFPQPAQVVYNASQWIGAIFLFAAIMFNFVILLRTMVQEKELRLKEGLKMMGLKEISYWGSWFAYYNIVMLLCSSLLIASGFIFDLQLITKNEFSVYFVLLMLFGESMIFFAFLLESILSSSQLSATLAFVYWIVMCAAITPINQLIFVDSTPKYVLNLVSLLSPLCFSKGISDLALAGAMGGITWADISTFSEVFPIKDTYYFLLIDCAVYFVLAWYISNVFPGEFGVPKPFLFFLYPSYWMGSRSKTGEKTPLLNDQGLENAVSLSQLHKKYKIGGCKKESYFHAVKGVSLTMQSNQLFCMLGPNGAGKTTIIGMLTGLFPATGGNAHIFGNSIINEMDKIRLVMGVCPQHDLLWDDMTAREHLEFFCRFKKNAGRRDVEKEVKARLEEIGLTGSADIPVSAFSGGEKRRLSVALALSGNPKIVFLDEPTTGMDPVSRHQVWEIIQKAKAGRVVILTTHSMEEADMLSDKIAIITHGELRCLGTNLSLKNEYGIGYQLKIYQQNTVTKPDQIIAFCTRRIGDSTVTYANSGCTTVNIPKASAHLLPSLLRELEATRETLSISEITVNLSSLEDVFLTIAGADEDSDTTNAVTVTENIQSSVDRTIQEGTSNEKYTTTPFTRQFSALLKKNVSSQIRNWGSLTMQLLIPVLIVAVMYASGLSSSEHVPENLHPVSLPPSFSNVYPPPKFTFPYYSPDDLGTCCNSSNNGLLGNVTVSVLNSTEPGAQSLGTLFSTNQFYFQGFGDKDVMNMFLYANAKLNWLAAYYFDVNTSIGQYDITLLHNMSDTYATVGYVNIISNAILRYTSSNPDSTLVTRFKQFPTQSHSMHPSPMNIEDTWCVIGLSFYMAIILSTIVFEKEHKQRYIMKMAGMRMSVYWLIQFLMHMFIYLLMAAIFIALALLFKIRYFTLNSPAIYITSFALFCFTQVGMSFFVSAFCSSTHSASLGMYVYIVTMALVGAYINPTWAQFGAPAGILYTSALIPHIAYGRLISYVMHQFFPEGQGMTWSDLESYTPLKEMYYFLLAESLFFFIFHQYFERVLPSEFNVPLSPFFFLKKSFWCPSHTPSQPQNPSGSYGSISLAHVSIGEPMDVAEERAKANLAKEHPVVVQGITKVFYGAAGTKRAVNDLAFTVQFGECFGLIGPNGGGKSTLINVLSGLYPASKGKAFINDYSVTEELTDVQRYIGVCPQDSIYWAELTGRQHLLYFGRLRGLTGDHLQFSVDQLLYQVMLVDAQYRPAGGYSGGMKRRLSLAISLIGNPIVVMLDEPTTGVDPFSKRVVWDVIRAYKHHCAIILTTHSMEEAEALCDRVCILDNGSMKCIGKPIELKARYCAGYSLTISHKRNKAEVERFVKDLIQDAQLVDDLSETLVFSLPKESVIHKGLGTIFEEFQKAKEPLGITDWGILQSSLADVLLHIVHKKK